MLRNIFCIVTVCICLASCNVTKEALSENKSLKELKNTIWISGRYSEDPTDDFGLDTLFVFSEDTLGFGSKLHGTFDKVFYTFKDDTLKYYTYSIAYPSKEAREKSELDTLKETVVFYVQRDQLIDSYRDYKWVKQAYRRNRYYGKVKMYRRLK